MTFNVVIKNGDERFARGEVNNPNLDSFFIPRKTLGIADHSFETLKMLFTLRGAVGRVINKYGVEFF